MKSNEILKMINNDPNISDSFKNAVSGDMHTHTYFSEEMTLELECSYKRVKEYTEDLHGGVPMGDILEDFEVCKATIVAMFNAKCNMSMPEDVMQKFAKDNDEEIQRKILEEGI